MIAGRLRMVVLTVVVACTSFVGCAHRVAGRVPGPWELRGAVVDATGDRLQIRHKTGQVVELVMDERTVVLLRDDKPALREALRRGRRVLVVVEPQPGGAQLAKTVHVYGGT